MAEATGNMAQISPEEAGEQKKTRKAPKVKTKAAKPEPEKVETAAAPEPEAAPETNGASKIDELEPEASAVEEVADPTGPGIQEKIRKERQELAEKMLSGKVEEGKLLKVTPQYIDAPIFPDAYCPRCGMKLSGNSKTGFKQAFYTHPFTPAIALGRPCELKGKKLRAPTARMEIVD